jgi:hypothetical protein
MQYLPVIRLAVQSALLLSGAPLLGAKCPNLHIVLDRSGSMTSRLPSGVTRWDAAKAAVNKVAQQYDGKLPIGLSIFPAGGCNSELVTPPDYKTKDKIKMAMDRMGATGSTPSGQAVHDAAMIKQLRDPERKQYIILVTDGGPGCGALDTVPGTVNEIKKALMQNPSIATFVVGFGGGLSISEKQALTQMADAGGKPAPTPEKFYLADDADQLNKALADIFQVVRDEFGGMLCDDSCYANGCPNPGELCIRGNCSPNPCAGVSCGRDEYCYTDGVMPGRCVRACVRGCPTGTRCDKGACIKDPCGYPCGAERVCNAGTKMCEPDPLCQNRPVDEQCKGSSRCQYGMCVDDPCNFITCPRSTRCVAWDGSCVPIEATPPASGDGGTGGYEEEGRRGCAAAPGGAAAAPVSSLVIFCLVFFGLRRRAH